MTIPETDTAPKIIDVRRVRIAIGAVKVKVTTESKAEVAKGGKNLPFLAEETTIASQMIGQAITKKRSKHHHSSTHNTHSLCHERQQKQHQHLPWLTPHIRVRVISKTISKYYAQNGTGQPVVLGISCIQIRIVPLCCIAVTTVSVM